MQEEWYVELDGVADGPHQRHAVLQMREAGRLDTGTLVWRDGFSDWVCYAEAGLEPARLPPERHATNALAAPRPANTRFSGDPFQDLVPCGNADNTADGPPHAPRLEVEDDGWQWTAPAPWRRYLARVLDMYLLGSLSWMAFSIVSAAINKTLFEAVFTRSGMLGVPVLPAVVAMAALIPAQALLIGLSGTTLGKWIFGVRITRRDGRAIGIRAALVRELSVFGLGLGGGIPFLACIPILIAHQVLTRTGATQWDRGKDWVVTQRAPGETQNAMVVLGLALLLTVGTLVRHAGTLPR
jgi:uncharacterized RDD family membrane protein YckC